MKTSPQQRCAPHILSSWHLGCVMKEGRFFIYSVLFKNYFSQNFPHKTGAQMSRFGHLTAQPVRRYSSLLYVVSDNMLISVEVNNTAELTSSSGEYMVHVGYYM